MSTSKDVARAAKVSVSTVSRVFSKPESVKPETRSLVLETARQLQYSPNIFARNLKLNRSDSVGISIGSYTNPFFPQVIEYLYADLERHGYQLLTFPPYGASLSESQITRYLNANQIDAFLFTPWTPIKSDYQLLKTVNQYCLQLYTDTYEDISSVINDDKYGCYLAVRHLLSFRHRRILLITMPQPGQFPFRDGYYQAFQEMGIPVDERLVTSHDDGEGCAEFIKQQILMHQPTALITHAELLTLKALSVLKELNLNYPEDISLICYDDHPWTKLMGITAVAQPIPIVAHAIAANVVNALSSPHASTVTKQKIRPNLILRGSVKELDT